MSDKMKLCVFGILKTKDGIAIKDEMLSWLIPVYDVLHIEQEPPGVLFEYPAIKCAADLSLSLHQPVLYCHTKGAANPHHDWFQPLVRRIWKKHFGDVSLMDRYFKILEEKKNPAVVCLFTGSTRICWFNAFIMNEQAAQVISSKLKTPKDVNFDRYYYENMFKEMNDIEIISIFPGRYDTPSSICKTLKELENKI